ncbi:181aa long hypothetical protein [Pyrococcus horikoshii OT3]|uniref:Uncharacterized protein n=1 Tax=Pyrococcus horikoshii (strain ATCC 700860 / DSM 12428 / JCM 9974 / NBRC 100139 / OT-3) TaxID=70601 RepID=O58306_PYRHO|nr:181aa long hypothetical protein [Pyrococcus horikoshii OT3]
MNFIPIVQMASMILLVIASFIVPLFVPSRNSRILVIPKLSLYSSVTFAILAIISTASIGNFPTAVSSDNITASVPSSIALATSVTSALVGTFSIVMETSIWVAVITGFPSMLAFLINLFWRIGSCSIGISTPRSPLAIIIPSAAFRISLKFLTASGLSILAITKVSPAPFLSKKLFAFSTS